MHISDVKYSTSLRINTVSQFLIRKTVSASSPNLTNLAIVITTYYFVSTKFSTVSIEPKSMEVSYTINDMNIIP